jgi:hypothetical protein
MNYKGFSGLYLQSAWRNWEKFQKYVSTTGIRVTVFHTPYEDQIERCRVSQKSLQMAWVRPADSTSKSYLKHTSVLGPIQPPSQWEPRDLSQRVKWPGCEADHSPQKVPWSRLMDLYIHCPIRLHGVVLRQLSTGTTLKPKLIYDSRPVCLGAGIPSGSHDQISFIFLTIASFLI